MRRLGLICALCALTPAAAVAQESEPAAPVVELPAPTLEEEEPVAPPEPLPAPEEEEESPQILSHIGIGDHPEWEEDNEAEVPRDIPFEGPGDARSSQATRCGFGAPSSHGTIAAPSAASR